MSLTCLNVTQRRLKSFSSPRVFHQPIQFLLSRLEIVQLLQVMKSKTLGSHLTAIILKKLTSTIFVAPPHVLFTKLEKLGTFYPDLLRNVLFMHLFLQNLITATAFFSVSPPTSLRNYNGCKIQPQG